MAEVSIRLAVEGRKRAASDLRGTADDVDRIDSRMTRLRRSAMGAAQGLTSLASRSIGAGLRATATGAGVLAAGLGAVAVAGATVGIKTAANMEQANIAFTTMLGSGEKAQGFLADLNAFAAKTPFDFPGLTTAASSLISAGIDASKVIPIMTTLGNATSGMGTGAEGIQRATIALQQMNAAGRITGEDLNQLRDAGIPVFDLLAAATGKSKEEVSALAQAGKLGKKELEQLMGALESGKGLERFNGLMEKQSASLAGMAATLKDTTSMGLSQAFQPAIPFLKTVLTDTNTLVTRLLPAITSGVGKVTAAIAGAYEIFVRGNFDGGWWSQLGVAEDSKVIDVLFRVRDAASAAFTYLQTAAANTDWSAVWDRITGALASAREAFFGVKAAVAGVDFAKLGDGMRAFGSAAGDSSVWSDALRVSATLLGTALQFLSDHMDTIIKYAPLIVAGFAAWKLAQQAAVVVQIAGLPLKAAEIVSTFALAQANMALAVALGYTRTSRLAAFAVAVKDLAIKVKDLAVITALAIRYAAYQVAIGLVTVATKVAAAGQWLLNAAMSANPIGLVIAGIVALVAGLVWFFTKTEAGRKAWGWLTDKFREGWAFINNTLVPIFKVVLAQAVETVKGKFETVRDAVGGFIDKIKSAWEWVKKLADRISDSPIGKAISAGNSLVGDLIGRATGGPVVAGTPYMTGEQGREMFIPTQNGVVLNHRETLAALNPSPAMAAPISLQKDDFGLSSQAATQFAGPRRIEIPVVLNGREIARAVYDDAGDKMARSM